MKKFLVLYQSTVPTSEQMKNATPEQAKAGMDAWMSWAGRAGSGIVDMGSPVATAAGLNGPTHRRRQFAGRRLLDSPGRIEGCADGSPEKPSALHVARRIDRGVRVPSDARDVIAASCASSTAIHDPRCADHELGPPSRHALGHGSGCA